MYTWGEVTIMPGIFKDIFEYEFTDTDIAVITHNKNYEYIKIKVIVDTESRTDLVKNIIIDVDDPQNKLTVKLTSIQTGIIQVFETDFVDCSLRPAYRDNELVVASGILQQEIDNLGSTLVDLIDTPGDYDVGKCLVSTSSGTSWGFPIVYEASDEGVSSTSGKTLQQKVRLTANDVVAGKYKISWCFEWSYSSTSSEIVINVQLNDTEDLANYIVKPAPADTSKFTCCGGFYYKTLTAGTHYVDIDWCSGSNGKTSSIRRARIDMWRVL